MGALGLRHLSGQLTLQVETKYYCIAFDNGMIVGATSPLAGDSVARIALINHFATSPQIPAITRRLAASPDRDEVDVLAEMNALTPDQKFRLRCRVIAQRAARTFSVERGDFIVHEEVTISTHPEVAADVRGIVFLGARMNLPEQRLSDDLRPYGKQFQLRPSADAELPGFGFAENERAIVEAIRAGASLPELEARYRDIDPRTLRAIVYALLSCGAMDAVAPNPLPSAAPVRPVTISPIDMSAGAGFKMRERKPVTTAADLLKQSEQQPTFEPSRTATASRPVEPRTTTTGPRPLGPSPLPPRTTTTDPRDPFAGLQPPRTSTTSAPTPARTTTTEPPGPFAGAPRTTTTDPFGGMPRTTTQPPRDPFAGMPRTTTTEPPFASRTTTTEPPFAPRTTTTEPRDRFAPPVPSRTQTPIPEGTPRTPFGVPTSPRTEPGLGGIARPPLAAASPLAPSPPSAARVPTPPSQGPPLHVSLPERMASPRRTNPQMLVAAADDGANTPMALPGSPRTTTPAAPSFGQGTPTEPAIAKGTQGGPSFPDATPTPSGPSFPRAPTPLPTRAGTNAPPLTGRAPTDPVANRTPTADPFANRPPTDPNAGRTPTPSFAEVATGRVPTPPAMGRASTDPAVARTTSDASDSASRRMPSGSIPPPPRTRTNPTYTTDPEPPRTTTDQSVIAEEAFTRGKTALRREELGEAIAELTRAAELNPHDVDYQAVLVWARFCAASDKNSVAEHTRKVLGRAVVKSHKPEVSRFYLGRVERMLGRDKEALRHFQAVLEAQPRHADAAAEVRMLEARIASDKGGFFGRKK